MKLLNGFFVAAFALLVADPTWCATPAEIKAAIEARFQVTTRGMTGNVKTPGTVLVVQQEGIRASKPSGLMTVAKINSGKLLSAASGGVLDVGGGRPLKVGDRLYLLDIKPAEKWVILMVSTVDAFDTVERGSSRSKPLQAAVSFQYDAGISAITTEEIIADIESWFKTEKDSATSNTKTIQLGQTPDEVSSILGAPDKKIELGEKVIYVYKDLRVIFIGGKVSDVE